MVVQASPDGGRTWNAPSYVCPCPHGRTQYDPSIHVTSTGVVQVVWLGWYSVFFATSSDHGRTWSRPVEVSGPRWADKPWIGSSSDGRDVYVSWSQGDLYMASSRDFGQSWSAPVKINTDKQHYYYPNGFAVLPGGTALMSASSYPCGKGTSQCRGPVNITVFRSTDGGATWAEETIDTVSTGVDFDTSSTTTLAADGAGDLVLVYGGARSLGANGRVWVRRSTDGGRTWSAKTELTPGAGSNGSFPAVAGFGAGRFVATHMDDRTGAWNTWARTSTDGGTTWSRDVRLSNATRGAPYKSSSGFGGPYGDYDAVAITASGSAVAVWGEGTGELAGPGGIWFSRQR
jgi:Neuraminidase (sialidase)